jgi:hypothetical protein
MIALPRAFLDAFAAPSELVPVDVAAFEYAHR